MAKANTPFSWKVKYFNCNAQCIADYDILGGRYNIAFIKKLKKKCLNKAEFSEALEREMMRMFWSKCEWELILELDDNNHIWLNPWVGCREPENVRIDVTENESFDWRTFIGTQCLRNGCAKIDVYDQLKYKWDEFITYLWTTRLPYERKHINLKNKGDKNK